MTWESGSERILGKLMEYERRLEELLGKRPERNGICQYHSDALPPKATRQARSAHRAPYVNETLARVNPDYVPSGA